MNTFPPSSSQQHVMGGSRLKSITMSQRFPHFLSLPILQLSTVATDTLLTLLIAFQSFLISHKLLSGFQSPLRALCSTVCIAVGNACHDSLSLPAVEGGVPAGSQV